MVTNFDLEGSLEATWSALDLASSALDASLNPHRLALRYLTPNRWGGTVKPYHEESFKIWSRLLAEDETNLDAQHHLAIMHHARAIDLEDGDDPSASNDDWATAMRLWHGLWVRNDFWDRIADQSCAKMKMKDSAPVLELRQRFPKLYLQVHFDIAFHPATQMHRTNWHTRLAKGSPFSAEALADVRQATYERLEQPNEAWGRKGDLSAVWLGLQRIREFLDKDPDSTPALCDASRLQRRKIDSAFTDWTAASDEASQRAVLRSLKAEYRLWYPSFHLLAENPENLPQDVIDNLERWFNTMGQVDDVSGDYLSAIENLTRSLSLCSDDESRRRTEKRLLLCKCKQVGDRVHGDPSGSLSNCSTLGQHPDLTPEACRYLVDVYIALKEFKEGETLSRYGQDLTLPDGDFEESERWEKYKVILREQEAACVFAAAYREFIQSKAEDPDERSIRACLDRVERASQMDPARERYQEAAREIRDALGSLPQIHLEIESRRSRILECGGERAFEFANEASKCISAGDLESAVKLFRQALQVSSDGTKLRAELAAVYLALAVQHLKTDSQAKAAAYVRWAQTYDPSNREVSKLTAELDQAGYL